MSSANIIQLNVKDFLPHREPFLFVDHVSHIVSNERIVAEKKLTGQEDFFAGHFPKMPIMPGVLMIEALAQTAGILIHYTLGTHPDANATYVLASIKNARFKRVVIPGDIIKLSVELEKHRDAVWQFKGVIHVEGELAVEATFINMRST